MGLPQKRSKTVKDSILNDEIQFLTIEECAKYLRVSGWTIRQWIKRGKGPPIKYFSHQSARIPKKAFLDWATAQGR